MTDRAMVEVMRQTGDDWGMDDRSPIRRITSTMAHGNSRPRPQPVAERTCWGAKRSGRAGTGRFATVRSSPFKPSYLMCLQKCVCVRSVFLSLLEA